MCALKKTSVVLVCCLFSFSFHFTEKKVVFPRERKNKKTQEFLTFTLYLIQALSFTLRALIVYETTHDATQKQRIIASRARVCV